MYTPPAFRRDDRAWALKLIECAPFGSLLTVEGGAIQTSFLPMYACEREQGIVLLGHVARVNPHARSIEAEASAVAQFLGPHAFVSASWYEDPYATVPTWNYAAVIAEGHLRIADSRAVVDGLSRRFEAEQADPWRMADLSEDVLAANLRGIVAFELHVVRLHAKAKLSQNRTAADRDRVIAHLSASPRESDRACARAMRAANERDDG